MVWIMSIKPAKRPMAAPHLWKNLQFLPLCLRRTNCM
ncbi:Uncharacterised protein [Vibrio cholerae]|nr:Uncharacterised protein [Vibrio cholerae]